MRWLFLIALILVPAALARGQSVETTVYVTTQDFSSLRDGPGEAFTRLAVVPPATTLTAIGRAANMQWVQVEYDGQRGWIAAWLLVWSGDIVSLPVDGVDPEPFIRRAFLTARTIRDARYYQRELVAAQQLGFIPRDSELEITGRMGMGERFWVQVRFGEQLVWVGSWDLTITAGSWRDVLDTSYLYPYGRLVTQLERDANRGLGSLGEIEAVWLALAEAQTVACSPLPDYVTRIAVDNDVAREPIFAPIVTALDSAIADVNAAISTFADACALPDDEERIMQSDVGQNLTALASARRNLTLALALLAELRNRNPLLNPEP